VLISFYHESVLEEIQGSIFERCHGDRGAGPERRGPILVPEVLPGGAWVRFACFLLASLMAALIGRT